MGGHRAMGGRGGGPGGPAPARVAATGLVALAVAMGIGRFAFTPVLPLMQADRGLSLAAGGWLAAANYLGYLAGALGAVGAPLRPAGAVRAGLATIVAATLGMAVTDGLVAWALLRGLAGIGSAWVLIFGAAWALARLAPAGSSALGGVVFAGVGTGIAAAGGVCLALGARGGGSAAAWASLGGLALAGTAAVWRALGPDPAPPAASAPAGPAPSGGGRGAARLVACYGTFGFGYIVPATFVPAMARERVADPSVFGWAWPLFGAAAALSTLLAAAAGRRLGHRRLWILGQLVMAAGVLAPVLWPDLAGITLAAVLVGGTFMVTTMAGLHEARALGGPGATRLMAAMTVAFALGQTLGPVVVGLGAGVAPALVSAAALLAAGAAALAWPPPARPARHAPGGSR
jgi:hypothetical protein